MPDHVRLRNVWSGRYLAVVDTGGYTEIRSKTLNTGWSSQVGAQRSITVIHHNKAGSTTSKYCVNTVVDFFIIHPIIGYFEKLSIRGWPKVFAAPIHSGNGRELQFVLAAGHIVLERSIISD